MEAAAEEWRWRPRRRGRRAVAHPVGGERGRGRRQRQAHRRRSQRRGGCAPRVRNRRHGRRCRPFLNHQAFLHGHRCPRRRPVRRYAERRHARGRRDDQRWVRRVRPAGRCDGTAHPINARSDRRLSVRLRFPGEPTKQKSAVHTRPHAVSQPKRHSAPGKGRGKRWRVERSPEARLPAAAAAAAVHAPRTVAGRAAAAASGRPTGTFSGRLAGCVLGSGCRGRFCLPGRFCCAESSSSLSEASCRFSSGPAAAVARGEATGAHSAAAAADARRASPAGGGGGSSSGTCRCEGGQR